MPRPQAREKALGTNFSVAPEEGWFCLTEILGIKIYLSCSISLSFRFILLDLNTADPDLHKDPASLRYCLCKWSFLYSFPFVARHKTAPVFGRGHRSRTLLNLLRSFFHSPTFYVFPVFRSFPRVFDFVLVF